METVSLRFGLVDVFARQPLSGNGLSIFLLDNDLPTQAMQQITQEMRQFESIFVSRTADPTCYRARIFTMEEELGFAGHPIIGAAAFLHARHFGGVKQAQMRFVTQDKVIPVTSKLTNSVYCAEMDQGEASFQAPVDSARYDALLSALNLSRADLADHLPLQVVSTGLPYLIVPLRTNLERASIRGREFESLLASVGAKFVYVLDVANMETRTWDNDGRVEDIATGSAAGPAAAYLVQHELANTGETIVLRQGRFVGRPSELRATVRGVSTLSVSVSGQVCFVGSGVLELPSSSLQPFGGRSV